MVNNDSIIHWIYGVHTNGYGKKSLVKDLLSSSSGKYSYPHIFSMSHYLHSVMRLVCRQM